MSMSTSSSCLDDLDELSQASTSAYQDLRNLHQYQDIIEIPDVTITKTEAQNVYQENPSPQEQSPISDSGMAPVWCPTTNSSPSSSTADTPWIQPVVMREEPSRCCCHAKRCCCCISLRSGSIIIAIVLTLLHGSVAILSFGLIFTAANEHHWTMVSIFAISASCLWCHMFLFIGIAQEIRGLVMYWVWSMLLGGIVFLFWTILELWQPPVLLAHDYDYHQNFSDYHHHYYYDDPIMGPEAMQGYLGWELLLELFYQLTHFYGVHVVRSYAIQLGESTQPLLSMSQV